MNNTAARRILRRELAAYQSRSYDELALLIGQTCSEDIEEPDGTMWQVRIEFLWDDEPNGHIRVLGAIDDGGIRALLPLTDSFIVNARGEMVDE